MKLIEDVLSFLKAPFVGEMSLTRLFLLVGAIIVFASLWFIMLHNMRRLASEVS